jgi:hypothetical protein
MGAGQAAGGDQAPALGRSEYSRRRGVGPNGGEPGTCSTNPPGASPAPPPPPSPSPARRIVVIGGGRSSCHGRGASRGRRSSSSLGKERVFTSPRGGSERRHGRPVARHVRSIVDDCTTSRRRRRRRGKIGFDNPRQRSLASCPTCARAGPTPLGTCSGRARAAARSAASKNGSRSGPTLGTQAEPRHVRSIVDDCTTSRRRRRRRGKIGRRSSSSLGKERVFTSPRGGSERRHGRPVARA